MIQLKTLPQNAKALQDLRELGADLQKKGVVSAMQSGTLPLVASLKARAPDDPKTGGSRLSAAINRLQVKGSTVLQTSSGKRNINVPDNVYGLVVGPNKGSRKKAVGWLGHILQVGAKKHDVERIVRRTFRVFSADGLSYKNKRVRFNKAIKYTGGDGGFSRGPIVHPGFGARDWIGSALSEAEPLIDERFYAGLNKWIAKNGR